MAILKNTTIDSTGFIKLPTGTTGQRTVAASAGMIRYNTTTSSTEWYDATYSAWFPTGLIPPIATGGTTQDYVINGATYRIHSFTSIGNTTFTVTRKGIVDYLIVAGGGSGGVGYASGSCVGGSGGGAGGLLTGKKIIEADTYTITVGAGGASQTTAESQGNNGENSSALGFTAIGGGGGGARGGSPAGALPGKAGGSGGGGNHANYPEGLAGQETRGQGHPGGYGFDGGGCQPGSGGGAGSPGEFGYRDRSNQGGEGLYVGHIFTENFGESGWFAGGGSAGINGSNAFSRGGIGGAVDTPSSRVTPDPGLANSGAGGCGGANGGNGFTNSGAGGSGIVLIRYRIA